MFALPALSQIRARRVEWQADTRLQFRRRVLGARGANLKALLSIGLTLLSATGTTRAGVYAGEAPDATELLADFRASVKFSHVSDRRWIDLKYGEVRGVYALLDRHPIDTVAVKSGRWSDVSIWSSGSLPGPGDVVWIPVGIRVEVDRVLPVSGPKLLRVDGTVAFANRRDTRLGAETILVTHRGRLEVGTRNQRVAPNVSAEIVFSGRGARNREIDPFDLTGGLLVTGELALFGAFKHGVAVPRSDLREGATSVRFESIPDGWRAGDRLLVPGVSKNREEDEVARIAAINRLDNSIELDTPLRYTHRGPRPGLVPVGNLSRNVVLRSAVPEDVSRRGHVLIVHRRGGVEIDSVRFEELGRTRADTVATRPRRDVNGELVAGSDSNTIGRYILHFHNRIGATRGESHRVERTVFEGGPRHGLVNHGGHVYASDNVSFRVAGAHFFAENGAEIGAFQGNLAVSSAGSGEDLKSRMYTFDFGHGGHGFWVAGGGVSLKGNFAFGHAGSAFIVFSRLIEEPAGIPWFDARNLPERVADSSDWEPRLGTNEVPFTATSNVAGASESGFQVWYHKRNPRATKHRVFSTLDDSVFWATRKAPLVVDYAHHVKVRNVALFGGEADDLRGVRTNSESTDLVFKDMEIRGFRDGIQVPRFGNTEIVGGRFANERNFVIYTPISWGRRVIISGTERFDAEGPWRTRYHVVMNRKPRIRTGVNVRYLYDHNLFLADSIELDGEQVYFFDQAPEAVPFPEEGPAPLVGLTSGEIRKRYGLTVGGGLAGPDAAEREQIRGLVGKPSIMLAQAEPLFEESGTNALRLTGYRLPDGRVGGVNLAAYAEGWQLIQVEGTPEPQYLLAYVDRTAPTLQLDAGFPQTVCPQDLDWGLLVAGRIHDPLNGAISDTKFRRILYRYDRIDPDYVAYKFKITDITGNTRPITVRLRVDPETPCRGPNIDHYLQVPLKLTSVK